jgi:hypothetical protein
MSTIKQGNPLDQIEMKEIERWNGIDLVKQVINVERCEKSETTKKEKKRTFPS